MKKDLFKSLIAILFVSTSHMVMRGQCTATTVPYYEDFSSVTVNNQLPPCWAATNLSNTCLTYPGYAAFLDLTSGPHYFSSRELLLNAGVTYSASLWKKSSLQSSSNSLLAILIDASQNFSSQTFISFPSPVTGTIYTPTSNTFNVANTGTYYIGVAGAFMSSANGEYIYWDDLRVEIPCTFAGNSPTVTITSSSPTICAGSSPTLYANGADTYSWSSGAQTSSIIVQQNVTTQFVVTGTNTLTGCSAIATLSLPILPTPVVTAISTQPSVCIGKSVALNASGAPSYLWSTGATSPATSVSPGANTTYTVTGTNVYGCSAMATVFVGVYPLPVISITPSSYTLCENEIITLVASGGTSYLWQNTPFNTATSLTVRPPAGNFTYTIKGFNNNGCESVGTSILNVSECTGLHANNSKNAISIYPNPCQTHLSVEGVTGRQTINIYDLSGRNVFSSELLNGQTLDVSFLESGLYILQVNDRRIRFMKE